MDLNNPSFKLCEEVLDVIIHFSQSNKVIKKELVLKSVNKSERYFNSVIRFLELLKIINLSNDIISLNFKEPEKLSSIDPASLLKSGLTQFPVFTEYSQLLQSGKSEKQVLKILKASFNLKNDVDIIKKQFDGWLKYLGGNISIKPISNKITSVPDKNNFFWINETGQLIYNQKGHSKQFVAKLDQSRYKNSHFINQQRIQALISLKSDVYDLRKLIKLCEEIDDAYLMENYFSVGALTRAILDHVPPIFAKKSFSEVANNFGNKSFRDTMLNLEIFSRKIADGILHTQIRRKENLPNQTTIDCRNAIDILLGEIVNLIKDNGKH